MEGIESHLIWYIVAGLLFIAEALTPGAFIFICFASAAFATAIVDQFMDMTNISLVIIMFVLSFINLLLLKPILQRFMGLPHSGASNGNGTAGYAEKLIGQEAMVFKEIGGKEAGAVKLFDADETWTAKSKDGSRIGNGTTVKILKVKGNVLEVEAK